MMGNIFEWVENQRPGDPYGTGSSRGLRGGAYRVSDYLAASGQIYTFPYDERYEIGFRVASDVPEPVSLVLLSLGGSALLKRRRRA